MNARYQTSVSIHLLNELTILGWTCPHARHWLPAPLLVVVIAWYSTYVVEPVVQSVILVERSPVAGAGAADTQEINSSTVEEVGPGFDNN